MIDLINQPQKVIATLFGFKEMDYNISKNAKVLEQINTKLECKSCGRIQDLGYFDPHHILINKSATNIYSFLKPQSHFFCAYCYYIQKNYQTQYQKIKSTNIADIVVYEKHYEKKDFKTDSIKNDLYFIFKTPPNPPFIIMLKEQINASVIVNMAHRAKPTIDKDLLVVNYGIEQHIVDRNNTLDCLRDYVKVKNELNKLGIKASDEVFFNRTKSPKYDFWFTTKLRNDDCFLNVYRNFINKYNESTRFVAKIMLQTYIAQTKRENNNGNI